MKITRKVKNHTFPWYTDRELVLIFQPESKEIIIEKINEWQENCDDIKKEIRKILNGAEKISETDEYIAEGLVKKFLLPHLYRYERHVWRLKRLLRIVEGKRVPHENLREKVERARIFPIAELARSHLVLKQSGKNFVALCPYHDERTPSCYFYAESNTFYCFGCHEKGDVIKLIMDLQGLEFKQAVEFLQN